MNKKRQQYIGSLTSGALLSIETKLLLPYLKKELLNNDWYVLFEKENVLQKKTVSTSMRYLRTIQNRFSVLQANKKKFIDDLLIADNEEFNQLLLLLIILSSPIIADFMINIIKPHTQFFEERLSYYAWDEFIADRMHTMSELTKYSENSLKKIGANIMNILAEVGYFNNTKERIFQRVFVVDKLKEWLDLLDKKELLEVFQCTI